MKLIGKSRLRKQEKVNTRRFELMMNDIRRDILRRTRNVRDLNRWMEELEIYGEINMFDAGGFKSTEALALVDHIAKTVDMARFPPGSNPEIIKGVISESCMNYVTRMGDDMKLKLKKTLLDCYNKKLNPVERAKVMSEAVDSLTRSRAKVIARTETIRSANLANLIISRDSGAKSYTVHCDRKACPICLDFYGDGSIIFDIDDTEHYPPYHPNCRCTPRFSTFSKEDLPENDYGGIVKHG